MSVCCCCLHQFETFPSARIKSGKWTESKYNLWLVDFHIFRPVSKIAIVWRTKVEPGIVNNQPPQWQVGRLQLMFETLFGFGENSCKMQLKSQTEKSLHWLPNNKTSWREKEKSPTIISDLWTAQEEQRHKINFAVFLFAVYVLHNSTTLLSLHSVHIYATLAGFKNSLKFLNPVVSSNRTNGFNDNQAL